jgi:hypothetical protein
MFANGLTTTAIFSCMLLGIFSTWFMELLYAHLDSIIDLLFKSLATALFSLPLFSLLSSHKIRKGLKRVDIQDVALAHLKDEINLLKEENNLLKKELKGELALVKEKCNQIDQQQHWQQGTVDNVWNLFLELLPARSTLQFKDENKATPPEQKI